jgi:hypothetical protein
MLDRIERAKARIATLHLDTTSERDRELRRVTVDETDSIETLLTELHRLHIAISVQGAELAVLNGTLAGKKATAKK